jgi:hypothetical protein
MALHNGDTLMIDTSSGIHKDSDREIIKRVAQANETILYLHQHAEIPKLM